MVRRKEGARLGLIEALPVAQPAQSCAQVPCRARHRRLPCSFRDDHDDLLLAIADPYELVVPVARVNRVLLLNPCVLPLNNLPGRACTIAGAGVH